MMQYGRDRGCGRNRDTETHRNLCEQKGKKTRPGGPGSKETLTEEETPEISCDQDVHGHAILQMTNTHTPVQILYLTNYNSVTFYVNVSTQNVCTGMFHLHQ